MKVDLTEALIKSWEINNQVSIYLIKNIPAELWSKKIQGYPRKTIGTLAVHLHNTRCTWIKAIEQGNLKRIPARIYISKGTRKEVLAALKQSNGAMLHLFNICANNEGRLPSRPNWLNFPNDLVHLVTYFIAHEAHHRGQIIMAIRQFGLPLKREVTGMLWQWSKQFKDVR